MTNEFIVLGQGRYRFRIPKNNGLNDLVKSMNTIDEYKRIVMDNIIRHRRLPSKNSRAGKWIREVLDRGKDDPFTKIVCSWHSILADMLNSKNITQESYINYVHKHNRLPSPKTYLGLWFENKLVEFSRNINSDDIEKLSFHHPLIREEIANRILANVHPYNKAHGCILLQRYVELCGCMPGSNCKLGQWFRGQILKHVQYTELLYFSTIDNIVCDAIIELIGKRLKE